MNVWFLEQRDTISTHLPHTIPIKIFRMFNNLNELFKFMFRAIINFFKHLGIWRHNLCIVLWEWFARAYLRDWSWQISISCSLILDWKHHPVSMIYDFWKSMGYHRHLYGDATWLGHWQIHHTPNGAQRFEWGDNGFPFEDLDNLIHYTLKVREDNFGSIVMFPIFRPCARFMNHIPNLNFIILIVPKKMRIVFFFCKVVMFWDAKCFNSENNYEIQFLVKVVMWIYIKVLLSFGRFYKCLIH